MGSAILALGCDQGTQHDEPHGGRAFVHVMAHNASRTQPLAPNGRLELAFDRLLFPDVSIRQTFTLTNLTNGTPELPPSVAYDPVSRVVSITPTTPLQGGQFYKVTISGAGSPSPLIAIDGSPLDPTTKPIEFLVAPGPAADGGSPDGGSPDGSSPDGGSADAGGGVGSSGAGLAQPPAIDFCKDILPVFVNKCSLCHSPNPLPAAGLLLDTADDIVLTTLPPRSADAGNARAAQGANTGPRSAPQAPDLAGIRRPLFGLDMPIIDVQPSTPPSGNPGDSWLMYKLLMAVPPACSATAPCDAGADAGPLPTAVRGAYEVSWDPIDPDERAALASLVPGREMPFPTDPAADASASTDPLTIDELERMSFWIAQGAATPTCH